MAIKDIRLFGDPVLRTPAVDVVDFDKELRTLVKDLEDTMLDAPGAGLAAPQIGVGLRVFTYFVDDVVGHLVNPLLDLSDETQDGPEGCLSIPGVTVDTKRALSVVAKGQNMHGEPVVLEGTLLLARACSTRRTTSTGSSSSTGSTQRRARRPCGRSGRPSGSASRRPG